MKKVLIIDDEKNIRDSISQYLSVHGFDTAIASDGAEGISLVTKNQYDLIFADLRMPKVDGLEFLEASQNINPDIPIVIISGVGDINLAIEALRKGASDFLTKPIQNMEILDITIKNVLDKAELLKHERSYKLFLEKEVEKRTKELKQAMSKLETNFHELEEAKQKAEIANQLKTTFLSNMSHEIRTPIYEIISFTEMLETHDCTEEERFTYLSIIKKNSRRILHLLNDLIEISKIKAGVIELQEQETALHELLKDTCKNFSTQAEEKGIKLILNRVQSFPEQIKIDSRKLTQIISHFIDNAIKHTNHGHVEITYKKVDNNIQFSVTDTGTGIPLEKHDKIFHIFSQGSDQIEAHEGTGLGLSISQAFAEAMGGKIWLESIPSEQTSFYFEVPLQKVSAKRKKVTRRTQMAKEERLVLITDDDRDILLLITTVLEQHGIKHITAANGQEAVAAVQKYENLMLVIMDIKMPVMDGHEATRQIKKILPDLPVLAHTAFAPELNMEKARQSGFDRIVSKPVDMEKLLKTINEYLG